jgi:hypothetical protein
LRATILGWNPRTSDIRKTAIAIIAVGGTLLLAVASAKVGLNWEQIYQDHTDVFTTRYMQVLFPMIFISGLVFYQEADTRPAFRLALGVFVSIILLGWLYRYSHLGNTLQLREIHWPVYTGMLNTWVPGLAFVATILLFSLTHLGIRPYFWAICANALLVTVFMTRNNVLQAHEGRGYLLPKAARHIAESLPKSQWNAGAVLSPNNNSLPSYFLTAFPGSIPIIATEMGRPISPAEVPTNVEWVAFLGGPTPSSEWRCEQLDLVTFCRRPRGD